MVVWLFWGGWISPEYSLEGLMRKLKLQYSGHLMRRGDSFEKTLMLGKTDGRRRRGRQRIRWLDGITDSMDMIWVNSGNWWWTGRPGGLRFMGSQRVGHDWETELNWTELQISSFVWHSSVFLSVSYSACITYFTFKIQGIIQTSSITLRQMTKMENITTYIQSILIYLIHKSSYKSREKIWTS